MATAKELKARVLGIFSTKWNSRRGLVIPEAGDVQLGNDAVMLDGTVLYADLRDSTGLVVGHKDWFAAEIYKAYLETACKIIGDHGGKITAFDGDRVMAVYLGNNKNTSAVRSGLEINGAVQKIINPLIQQSYKDTAFRVEQAVGIDTGPLFVARTGIRGSNDLVWVGRAANYAAKLCGLREGNYATYITHAVFQTMHQSVKNGGSPPQSMWEKVIWDETGAVVYRSHWLWELDG